MSAAHELKRLLDSAKDDFHEAKENRIARIPELPGLSVDYYRGRVHALQLALSIVERVEGREG